MGITPISAHPQFAGWWKDKAKQWETARIARERKAAGTTQFWEGLDYPAEQFTLLSKPETWVKESWMNSSYVSPLLIKSPNGQRYILERGFHVTHYPDNQPDTLTRETYEAVMKSNASYPRVHVSSWSTHKPRREYSDPQLVANHGTTLFIWTHPSDTATQILENTPEAPRYFRTLSDIYFNLTH